MEVTAIKCDKCGKLLDVQDKDFFTFFGNVCKGLEGGIIGNNLDDEDKVTMIRHYCSLCTSVIFGLKLPPVNRLFDVGN